MGVHTLLCLALCVVAALGSPRVRGDPMWQARENVAESRQGDQHQDNARYVQLPQSILDNLLSDPRYSEEVRRIIAANVAPEVIPVRPPPVQVTSRPTYQYKPQPDMQSEPVHQLQDVRHFEPQNEAVRLPSRSQSQRRQYQSQYKPSPAASNPLSVRHPAAAPRFPAPVYPTGNDLLVDAQIGHLLRNAPESAQLIATAPAIPALIDRLPDNATLIRPNIVDTFSCEGKSYGFYADVDNECQVFHVCLPLRQLYPANFTVDITYTFSFICPAHTIFSQDVFVCVWASDALPCELASNVSRYNSNFFRRVTDQEGGERWAHVNEPLGGGDGGDGGNAGGDGGNVGGGGGDDGDNGDGEDDDDNGDDDDNDHLHS